MRNLTAVCSIYGAECNAYCSQYTYKMYETDNKLSSNNFKNAYADYCIKLRNNSFFSYCMKTTTNQHTYIHLLIRIWLQFHALFRCLRFNFNFLSCCSIFFSATKPKTKNAVVIRFFSLLRIQIQWKSLFIPRKPTWNVISFTRRIMISSIGLAYCMDLKRYTYNFN